MLEVDLKNFLEMRYLCKAFPITVTEGAKYPLIVYKENKNGRSRYSSLNAANLREQTFTVTFMSNDDEWAIINKNDLIEYMDMFAGTLGTTKIFTTSIGSVIPTFDNAQRVYEYNVDVEFTKHA